jgi:hypothetical protein
MSTQERRSMANNTILRTLKPSDQAVFRYLAELQRAGNEETCTSGIPTIAAACNISARQVQISARRLIKAGLLNRVGYDFGNIIRARRGTIYRVLIDEDNFNHGAIAEDKKPLKDIEELEMNYEHMTGRTIELLAVQLRAQNNIRSLKRSLQSEKN